MKFGARRWRQDGTMVRMDAPMFREGLSSMIFVESVAALFYQDMRLFYR
jgi:hypothetical protein